MLESIHNIPEASLLALSTYLSIKGTTPPYVASEEDRSKAKKDSIARFTAVTSGFHFALLVSSALQARQLLQTQLGPTSNFNPNFRNKFVIANVIQILGGLLRIKCYKVLKQFFTFKLAVRKDHKVSWQASSDYPDLILNRLFSDFPIFQDHRLRSLQ